MLLVEREELSLDERITVHSKSRGETIEVYTAEYRGVKYLHIREWYEDTKDPTNQHKPTKKGVAIPLDKVEELRKAIDHFCPAGS